MLSPFAQEVYDYCKNKALPLAMCHTELSPHPIFKIQGYDLLLHLVALPRNIADELPAAFFGELSEKMAVDGLQIIHLWEDIWLSQTALVQSRINTLLGQNKRIYARLTQVKRIDSLDSNAFLEDNHTNSGTTARYKYGLFLKEELIGVASFSAARTFQKENNASWRSCELIRFATQQNLTVVGGLSKLINTFKEDVKPNDLMTYADRDWSAGNSYHKLGFIYEKCLDYQTFWVHLPSLKRYSETKLHHDFAHIDWQERAQMLRKEGYVRVYNSGSLKYRLIFG